MTHLIFYSVDVMLDGSECAAEADDGIMNVVIPVESDSHGRTAAIKQKWNKSNGTKKSYYVGSLQTLCCGKKVAHLQRKAVMPRTQR